MRILLMIAFLLCFQVCYGSEISNRRVLNHPLQARIKLDRIEDGLFFEASSYMCLASGGVMMIAAGATIVNNVASNTKQHELVILVPIFIGGAYLAKKGVDFIKFVYDSDNFEKSLV